MKVAAITANNDSLSHYNCWLLMALVLVMLTEVLLLQDMLVLPLLPPPLLLGLAVHPNTPSSPLVSGRCH